jgi:GPH family glycoside/pentoside/hexuronide:cation symporter
MPQNETKATKDERFTFQEKFGYGVGDLASNLFWMSFIFFLPIFYTDVFGISAAAAGVVLFATRLGDTFFDPLIGMVADRTKTRWGRFRPYLFWMALPFGLLGVLTFTTPAYGPTGKLVWAFMTCALMMIIYSAINIPYSALMGVMTSDSLERTRLSTYRFTCAFLGGVLVQGGRIPLPLPSINDRLHWEWRSVEWGTLLLKDWLGAGNEQRGYQLTAAVYALFAIVLFLITFFTTNERVQPTKEQKTPLTHDLGDLAHNVPWLILFACGLLTLTFVCIRNGSLVYYFKYYIGNEAQAANFMLSGTLANLLGALSTGFLTKNFGKKRLYLTCMTLAGAVTALYYLARPADITFLYVLNIIGGFLSGPPAPLIWAMYADAADYSEWKTGRRATGLVFSAASFGQKLGWALGGFIALQILAGLGYQANMTQAPATLRGIVLLMSFIPAVLTIGAGVMMLFYRLDESQMRQIGADMVERRLAGATM